MYNYCSNLQNVSAKLDLIFNTRSLLATFTSFNAIFILISLFYSNNLRYVIAVCTFFAIYICCSTRIKSLINIVTGSLYLWCISEFTISRRDIKIEYQNGNEQCFHARADTRVKIKVVKLVLRCIVVSIQ